MAEFAKPQRAIVSKPAANKEARTRGRNERNASALVAKFTTSGKEGRGDDDDDDT